MKRQSAIYSFLLWIAVFFLLNAIKVPLFQVISPAFETLTGMALFGRSKAIQLAVVALSATFISAVIILTIRNWEFPKRFSERIASWVVLLSSLVSFGLVGRIALTMVIRRDDFSEITEARGLGMLQFLLAYMKYNTGRFTSVFLKGFYSVFEPIPYIHFWLAIIFLVIFTGYVLLILAQLRQSADSSNKRRRYLFVTSAALMMTSLTYFVSPKIWEVYFWSAGGLIYGLGIAVQLFVFGLILLTSNKSLKNWQKAVLYLCAVVAGGFSELNSISNIIMAAVALFCLRHSKPHTRIALILLILFAIMSLLMPGNFHKAQSPVIDDSRLDLIGTLFEGLFPALGNAFRLLIEYVLSKYEFFLIAGFVFFAAGSVAQIQPLSAKPLALIIATLIVASWMSLMVNVLIKYIPTRVLSIPLTWLLIAVSLLAFQLGLRNPAAKNFKIQLTVFCLVSVAAAWMWGIFYRNNYQKIDQISAQWAERDRALSALTSEQRKGTVTTCGIEVMGSPTPDITADPLFEANIVAASYYQLEQVIAFEACP